MHYHHTLTSKGWQKQKCSACTGNTKARYLHPLKAGHEIVIFKLSGKFRYKENKMLISHGSINELQYQHFLQ